jgi:hypothetical protein
MLRCVLAIVLEGSVVMLPVIAGRAQSAEFHGGRRATYATRRAIVGRIVAVSGVV